MKIGCVKEIKDQEYRVGLTPSCVQAYVQAGHTVALERGAGEGAGFPMRPMSRRALRYWTRPNKFLTKVR